MTQSVKVNSHLIPKVEAESNWYISFKFLLIPRSFGRLHSSRKCREMPPSFLHNLTCVGTEAGVEAIRSHLSRCHGEDREFRSGELSGRE